MIGGIGAGFNSMGSIPRFLDLFDMDFFLLAMRYTLLEQDVLESEFPRCEERGVGIIVGGGYNSGILASGAVSGAMYNYAPAGSEIQERVRKIEAVCARHRVPLAAAALQFPLGHPIVASIIPGAISRAQVERNVPPSAIACPPTCGLSSDTRSSFGPTRPRRPKPFGGQASPALPLSDCGGVPIRHSFSRGATTARRSTRGDYVSVRAR